MYGEAQAVKSLNNVTIQTDSSGVSKHHDLIDNLNYSVFMDYLDFDLSMDELAQDAGTPHSNKCVDGQRNARFKLEKRLHASEQACHKLVGSFFSTPAHQDFPAAKSHFERLTPSTMSPSSEPRNRYNDSFLDLKDHCVRCGPFSDLLRDNYDSFKTLTTCPEDFEMVKLSPLVRNFPPSRSGSKSKELLKAVKEGYPENTHPYTCKPCVFYRDKGCFSGDDCQFCHQWHAPKRKKVIREQHNIVVIVKRNGKISYLRLKAHEMQNI